MTDDIEPGGIRIRVAAHSDREAIESLLRASDLPIAGVAELLERSAEDFVIAETGVPGGRRSVVGAAGLEVRGMDAVFRSAVVDPAFRSRGLGARLTSALLAIAGERGLRALYLLTTTAEDYFPRFGFSRITRAEVPAAIGETVEFREACPASAIVMMRPVQPAATASER